MKNRLHLFATAILAVAGVGTGVLLIAAVLAPTLRMRILMALWALLLIELGNLVLHLMQMSRDERIFRTLNDIRRMLRQLFSMSSCKSDDSRERAKHQKKDENRPDDFNKAAALQLNISEVDRTEEKPQDFPEPYLPPAPKLEEGVPAGLSNADSLYYPEATPEFVPGAAPADFVLTGTEIVLAANHMGRRMTPEQLRGRSWNHVFAFQTASGKDFHLLKHFRLIETTTPAVVEAVLYTTKYRLTRKGTIIIVED